MLFRKMSQLMGVSQEPRWLCTRDQRERSQTQTPRAAPPARSVSSLPNCASNASRGKGLLGHWVPLGGQHGAGPPLPGTRGWPGLRGTRGWRAGPGGLPHRTACRTSLTNAPILCLLGTDKYESWDTPCFTILFCSNLKYLYFVIMCLN